MEQTQNNNQQTAQNAKVAYETIFCSTCGSKIAKAAISCPHCGSPVAQNQQQQVQQPQIIINNANTNTNMNNAGGVPANRVKNKWVAFLLCFFLGYLGAHKFYEGKILLGILYILTVGFFGIGWIIDILVLLFKPNPYTV